MNERGLIDGLRLRRMMGRRDWDTPRVWGNGWAMNHARGDGRIIVTSAFCGDTEWIHASMSRKDRVPSYDDLKSLHRAAFPGWAYSVWPPASEHVNLHEYVLHLFGPTDGLARLPDFTFGQATI